MKIKNSPMEIMSRRYRSRMIVSGNAVMAFGAWDLLQIIVDSVLKTDEYERFLEPVGDDEQLRLITGVLIIIVIGAGMMCRVYARRAALKEARGRKKGNLYILLAAGFVLASAADIAIAAGGIPYERAYVAVCDSAQIVIEFTSMIASFDLVYSTIRMRRCEKKLNGAAADE